MKNKFIFLVIVLIAFSFFSCKKAIINSRLQAFYGNTIVFPSNLQCFKGEKINDLTLTEQCPKIIIWFDSTECGLCRIRYINNYQELEKYCQCQPNKLDIIYLFSPKEQDLSQILEEVPLNTKMHDYPIYIDTANIFAKLNPCIPKDKFMHSFLLDSEGKVVLVGSPILNQAMFDLYKKKIEEMIN